MRVIKIGNREIFIRFNTNTIKALSELDVNLFTVNSALERLDIRPLSKMFFYGVKSLKPEVTEDETDCMIDDFFEANENGFEKLSTLILEEYTKALGMGMTSPKPAED